jgi:hypothetical protein
MFGDTLSITSMGHFSKVGESSSAIGLVSIGYFIKSRFVVVGKAIYQFIVGALEVDFIVPGKTRRECAGG